MLDAVKTYFDAVDALTEKYTADVEAERTKYTGKRGAARTEAENLYHANVTKIKRLYEASTAVERAKLAMATSDPLIGWMLDRCTSYPDHVNIVMKALPMDIAGLRKLKTDNGWCSDFDELMRQAIRAGALDDGRSPARREFEEWIRTNFSIRDSWMAQISERVDQIVAAEAAAYVVAHKKAKKSPASGDDADTGQAVLASA